MPVRPTRAPRRHVLSLTAAASVLLAVGAAPALAAPAAPAPSGPAPAPVAESPTGRYFVPLAPQDSPGVEPGRAPVDATQRAEATQAVADFDEALDTLPEDVREGVEVTATHTTLWTGAVVEASADDAAVLGGLEGVGPVVPVYVVPGPDEDADALRLPVEEAGDPQEDPFAPLAPAPGSATSSLTETSTAPTAAPAPAAASGTAPAAVDGMTGRGLRLAVLDTGIDVDHPAFGGSGRAGTTPFPNSVVVGGFDFVGDSFDPNVPGSRPAPDANPDSSSRHGSHVTGLAAGRPVTVNGTTHVGVAPEAQILSYRIFSNGVGTSADVLIAAMERAMADGADVVNMSLALSHMSVPDYPTVVAAQGLTEQGVVVVAAMGNGPNLDATAPAYSVGAPAAATDVISVGSGAPGRVHRFSLMGPNALLQVKPDVLANGNAQTAACPLELVGSGLVCSDTGTSMASPKVAGQALLLRQKLPHVAPAGIRARIVGTAQAIEDTTLARLRPMPAQGAGLADPLRSLRAAALATPSTVTVGETTTAPETVEVRLEGLTAGTYTLGHEPAAALQVEGTGVTPDTPRSIVADATVEIPDAVTLTTGGASSLPITITAPASVLPGTIFGGHVVLRDTTGAVALRIPYQGMVGDFTDLPLWQTQVMAEPMLTHVSRCSAVSGHECLSDDAVRYPVSENGFTPTAFTLDGTRVPNLLVALRYPASRLHVEAVRVTTTGEEPLDTKALPVLDLGGQPRGAGGYPNLYLWDGTYRNTVTAPYRHADGVVRADASAPVLVPDGLYRLRVTATRSLPSGEFADMEEWTSPTFRIAAASRPTPQWLLAQKFGPLADTSVTYGPATTSDVYVGDWDGDGVDGIAYRVGNTFHLRETATSGAVHRTVPYGKPGDTVYVGDWDGDGDDTFAVRRGNVFHYSNTHDGGPADLVIPYGKTEDEVVVGDWDGNRTDTPAVRRGTTFHFKNTLQSGLADYRQIFGRLGDVVLPGDFDDDGTDTLSLRRGITVYVRNDFASGPAEVEFLFGRPTDTPLVGRWSAGQGDTFGVHRRP